MVNQYHFHSGTNRLSDPGMEHSMQPFSRRPSPLTQLLYPLVLVAMGVAAAAISPPAPVSAAADKLVVYSGRAERLIKPVLDSFEEVTGIQVALLSSGTTELVNRLHAEGKRTQADLFITNDAGSL